MRIDHLPMLAACLPIILVAAHTAAAEEPEPKPFDVLGQSYGHRERLLTDTNGLERICKPIRDLAGDGRDVPGFEAGVEKFVATLSNLQWKAYAYRFAGSFAVTRARFLEDEPELTKQWFDVGEKFAKQGVVQGELAMAESLVTVARSLLELGRVYEYRDEDRPRALAVHRLASNAHSRLWFDTRRHAIHWEANRTAHEVMAESLQYQLRTSPDSELPDILIRPGLYRRMLRHSPIRAREATVIDPLLRHNLERTGGWLEAIAKESMTTDEEKAVLRKAAEILETWEVRESDWRRKFAEKEIPRPSHPFGP